MKRKDIILSMAIISSIYALLYASSFLMHITKPNKTPESYGTLHNVSCESIDGSTGIYSIYAPTGVNIDEFSKEYCAYIESLQQKQ